MSTVTLWRVREEAIGVFLSGFCTHCVTRVFAIGIWERHVISEIVVVAEIIPWALASLPNLPQVLSIIALQRPSISFDGPAREMSSRRASTPCSQPAHWKRPLRHREDAVAHRALDTRAYVRAARKHAAPDGFPLQTRKSPSRISDVTGANLQKKQSWVTDEPGVS